MESRSDREKFDITFMKDEFTGDARDTCSTFLQRFFLESGIRSLTSFFYEFGDLSDLASYHGFEARSQSSEKSERVNAVSYEDVSWCETDLVYAVDFIAGKSGGVHRGFV